MKQQNQFYISLYIIIPIIFAGFAVLGAVVAYRLTEYVLKHGDSGAGYAVFFWVIFISVVAFGCGLLLVRFLLKPAQRFVSMAKKMPAISGHDEEGVVRHRGSELSHMETVFDAVTDVLSKVDARQAFPEIIGESRAVRGVMSQIAKVAPADSTVLILGESGTGKELVANSIYKNSLRKGGPFIKLNCVAIPAELLESELFGHEKGAFTGAVSRKPGKFELADGGTLFLDEIGDMPFELQGKILRVLQEKEFDRLGGTHPIKVDVRIIAATNKNLEQLVADGAFREDLYYRLNVFTLIVPPLRERLTDVPLLIESFLSKMERPATVSPDAMQSLKSHDWPGNIRELQNVIERTALLGEGDITVKHLPGRLFPQQPTGGGSQPVPFQSSGSMPFSIDDYLKDIEKGIIVDALKRSRGVQVEAAKLLSINPRSFWHRVKKHNIEVSEFKTAK